MPVIPKLKEVSSAEFDAFIAAYPRPLERHVLGMFEPPLLQFGDATLVDDPEARGTWQFCVVACYITAYDDENPAHGWMILDQER